MYVHELEQVCPETGEWKEAKLDLDVVTREGRYLLDVSVFHPFQKGGGKFRHVCTSEREKLKYERYPTQKDGQRVTDAVLVPIILNTYGAVGDKAVEFLYAVAGAKAKQILDEISLLAVLLSADMILQSHAPSNLTSLISLPNPAEQSEDPVEQPAARGRKGNAHSPTLHGAVEPVEQPVPRGRVEKEKEKTVKNDTGFLRPDLRGEIRGKQVECLGCST